MDQNTKLSYIVAQVIIVTFAKLVDQIAKSCANIMGQRNTSNVNSSLVI
jgi:hypothetical protein